MAVTVTAQELAYRIRLIGDTSEALADPQLSVVNDILSAASALVLAYAPAAPAAIHNEAVTRLAGFLYDSPPGRRRDSRTRCNSPAQLPCCPATVSGAQGR